MMKTISRLVIALVTVSLLVTSCIDETSPQGSTLTGDQVANAHGAYDNAVNSVTDLVGTFDYGTADARGYDYGYPTFFLMWDTMGQDLVGQIGSGDWYASWYLVDGLHAETPAAQMPWMFYYKRISNCNIVLGLAGETPTEAQKVGAGLAHAIRALLYMDITQIYFDSKNPDRGTVPLVTEKTLVTDLSNNPRVPWDDMWAFILSDLNKAEEYLTGYERADFTLPDLSVVYGLKARAYLLTENWEEAERYAKLAQEGYIPTTNNEYTDRLTGFNTPTAGWMLGAQYKAGSPNVTANDSDSNWGAWVHLERSGGYASQYGQPFRIDRHLYETIPATDIRKKCYIDFALDEMSEEERTAALVERYSDYPASIDQTAVASYTELYGGLILKYRAGGGPNARWTSEEQTGDPYAASVVAVPMMRVEEMMLIEAEAAGRQSEPRGIALLTSFAQIRDPEYTYDAGKSFIDNVWWQRRVELFAEGFATKDIKRLGKGIIRSYAQTNHLEGARYNTTDVPEWMSIVIITTEAQYNFGLENNPVPMKPVDSPEHVW